MSIGTGFSGVFGSFGTASVLRAWPQSYLNMQKVGDDWERRWRRWRRWRWRWRRRRRRRMKKKRRRRDDIEIDLCTLIDTEDILTTN